jgi:hypothetical protein
MPKTTNAEPRLLHITLTTGLRHDTLVETWADILAIARRGTDAGGRPIESMEILCSDGKVRTYAPAALRAVGE